MEWKDIGLKCIKEAIKAIEAADNSVMIDRDNILTKADIASQNAILKVINDSGKDCLFYSEELEKPKQFGKDRSVEVAVDPLDGSMDFLKGIRYFSGVGIILLKNRKPIYSFVGRLSDNNIFHCDEERAYLNGKPIKCGTEVRGKPYVCMWAPQKKILAELFPKLLKLKESEYIYNNGGMFHCCDMILGHYDSVGELDPCSFHELAGAFIAERAGAVLSGFDGKPINYDPRIKQAYVISRNNELHEKVLGCFR